MSIVLSSSSRYMGHARLPLSKIHRGSDMIDVLLPLGNAPGLLSRRRWSGFRTRNTALICVLSDLDMCSVGGSDVDGPSPMSVCRCLHRRLMFNHAENAKPLSDFGHDPTRSGDLR